jgi:hypothetical protein
MRLLTWLGVVAAVPATIGLAGVLPANAATVSTVGVAVKGVGSSTQVGNTQNRGIGDDAIEYFIPLHGSGTLAYGVGSACSHHGYGTCSDIGYGGPTLRMVLRFEPSASGKNELTIKFEDLDLNGVNDPAGFLETLNLSLGTRTKVGWHWVTSYTPLAGPFSSLVSPFRPDGNSDTQILDLLLDLPTTDPLYLVLDFTAHSTFKGQNTPEYLWATLSPADANIPVATPLPGALVLMGSVLTSFFGVGAWRRRRTRPA